MKLRELFFFTVLLSSSAFGESHPCDAGALWERMVQAKGGREKLHAINTFWIYSRFEWRQLFVRHRLQFSTFYRFPDFVWAWDDSGVATLGKSASHTYLDRREELVVFDGGAVRKQALADRHLPLQQIPLLLFETRWFKPKELTCSIDGWTRIVEARFGDAPYAYRYYLQGDSLLPNRVDIPHGKYVTIFRFRDYREVAGLMLPHSVKRESGTLPAPLLSRKYEINPAYDPRIVDRQPSIDVGPDGWRAH